MARARGDGYTRMRAPKHPTALARCAEHFEVVFLAGCLVGGGHDVRGFGAFAGQQQFVGRGKARMPGRSRYFAPPGRKSGSSRAVILAKRNPRGVDHGAIDRALGDRPGGRGPGPAAVHAHQRDPACAATSAFA